MSILQRRFALIRRLVLGVLLLVPLVFALGAQPKAAIVQTTPFGLVSGIDDLFVGPETYNISFVFGPYGTTFGGALFSNASDIVDAIFPLLDTFGFPIIDPAPNALDLGTGQSHFAIPIELIIIPGAGEFLVNVACATGFSDPAPYCRTFSPTLFPPSYEPGVGTIFSTAPFFGAGDDEQVIVSVWAVPTLVGAAGPSTVPLPAALPLFGSALAMLGIVGWRRKRRAAA